MKYLLTPIAILISYANLEAATLQVGQFNSVTNVQHENVSISWSLEDDMFTVHNLGSDAVVTQVNFESGFLVSLTHEPETPDFSVEVRNLPQGNSISFDTSYGFVANPSPIINGIDTGETLTFKINETEQPFRVGIHVQSIGQTDLSDTFVAVVPQVPEPTSLSLLGLGGLSLILKRRK